MRVPVHPAFRHQLHCKARPDHWCHRRYRQRQIHLVNLIPRFYDATDGTVEIMGRDARNYPREELRGKAAMVMQKAQLFGGTIRSNLLWGNKNATDADLWAALETAQAAEFVKAKPLGLDEPVEQGGRNLSGGQKQRLTIARALWASRKF